MGWTAMGSSQLSLTIRSPAPVIDTGMALRLASSLPVQQATVCSRPRCRLRPLFLLISPIIENVAWN